MEQAAALLSAELPFLSALWIWICIWHKQKWLMSKWGELNEQHFRTKANSSHQLANVARTSIIIMHIFELSGNIWQLYYAVRRMLCFRYSAFRRRDEIYRFLIKIIPCEFIKWRTVASSSLFRGRHLHWVFILCLWTFGALNLLHVSQMALHFVRLACGANFFSDNFFFFFLAVLFIYCDFRHVSHSPAS